MVSTTLKITLSNPSGKITEQVQVPIKSTVQDLKKVIKTDCKRLKLATCRQKLSLPQGQQVKDRNQKSLVLEDERSLISYGVKDGSVIILKDLGPQISWRTVFFLEYLGPLLIHQAYLIHSVYFAKKELGLVQLLGYAMVTFHFLKREYETIMVHRFSHSTMPLNNLFKNSAHYWILSGFGIGHFLYSSSFQSSQSISMIYGCVIIFIVAELANFRTHLILRDLRPSGSTTRAVPRGFGFNLLSCPNYFFEMLAWCSFSLMTGLPSAWFFTVVASGQMWLWAVKKHERYLKEFPDYPKNRKPMIPFLC